MEILEILKEFGVLGVSIFGMFLIYSDMNKQQTAREEKYLDMINGSLKDVVESLQILLERRDK